VSSSTDDWKSQYEAHVQTWRTQSAVAREKAEKERERWEKIREDENAQRQAERTPGQGAASPSLADPRDLATSEHSRVFGKDVSPENPTPSNKIAAKPERQDTTEKWEEIPSVTSSFPSLSFPHSSGTSLDHSHKAGAPLGNALPPPTKAPLSATQAIFDPTLPTGARISAFFSSLAINMLLPFVNGVMLGFGEIFAKNVVFGWFGWNRGGTVASNVGVGVRRDRK
jgi:hypothetical protein